MRTTMRLERIAFDQVVPQRGAMESCQAWIPALGDEGLHGKREGHQKQHEHALIELK